jgi:hypothetical protein
MMSSPALVDLAAIAAVMLCMARVGTRYRRLTLKPPRRCVGCRRELSECNCH